MDNDLVFVNEDEQRIEVHFSFSWDKLGKVKELPDVSFDRANKFWYAPATPFHADAIISVLGNDGFYIGEDVYKMSQGKKVTPKLSLDKRLYPFQRDGVKFIIRAGGRCILADAMGLGKTPQALAFVNVRKGKTLIVAPANVIWKWKSEAETWTDGLSVEVIQKTKDELPDTDIHIMSYDIMKRKVKELEKIPYDTIIADESHYLKNYRTQRVKAFKRLAGGGIPHTLYLSGTPFLNKPSELFPVLNMIDPLSYPTFTKFAKRYLGAYWQDGWIFPDLLMNEKELRERLSSVMIRRTKQQVLKELPDKMRTIVPVDIPLTEYNKAKRDLSSWYKTQGKKLSGYNVLAKITALRQIVGKEKVKHTVSLAQDILQDDEQVVIFAHHKSVVGELRSALSEFKVGMIVGDTKSKARQEICEKFLTKDIDVVIISVAGAEGIDLYSASNIIFCEREWTPAKEEQAEDRLHRIGQKNSVNCWYPTAKGTIDEKFARLVQEKRDTFGKVVSQDEIKTMIQEYLTEV